MTVNILLSTYNGEKYLLELLNSLINQTYPHLKITIRDDGSVDETMNIIESFARTYGNISVIKGHNLGTVRSFLTLLEVAEPADFYAFCDQDDVWLPDKIERAVATINLFPMSIPVMYCSAYYLVDENLNHIGKPTTQTIRPGFGNALVENIATGCTIVINEAARRKLINKLPRKALMHDWWVYLVISAVGKVIYDPTPSILYRQHTGNAVGVKATLLGRLVNRIKQYRDRNGERLIRDQVAEFYDLYRDELDNAKLKMIERFLDDRFINKISNIFTNVFYRQSPFDNLIFKLLYLGKKI